MRSVSGTLDGCRGSHGWVEGEGAIHHVTARGNDGGSIVLDAVDRSAFMRRLARTVEQHRWELWAYCLLDNHFHLIVQTAEPNLGVGMKWLKASYAQDFNHRHGRSGHLFGRRFHSRLIQSEAHLVEACAYVVLNPVRAGVVRHPRDWPWSSYRAAAGLRGHPRAVRPRRLLELLDPTGAASEEHFVAAVDTVI